jgi:hypothetical protein
VFDFLVLFFHEFLVVLVLSLQLLLLGDRLANRSARLLDRFLVHRRRLHENRLDEPQLLLRQLRAGTS